MITGREGKRRFFGKKRAKNFFMLGCGGFTRSGDCFVLGGSFG
jgi:hypothetical protein